MDSANNKLYPYERANILRAFGFNIKKDSGQVYNIRNKSYKDKKPSLCINLDNGMVKDHGDSSFDGDIFNLLMELTGDGFHDIYKKCESIINRKLGDAKVVEYEIKDPKPAPEDFWSKDYKEEQKKSIQLLKNKGIEYANYVRFYDHIWRRETLERYGCGLYRYNDFRFGESEKSFLNDTFLSIPYKTGIMLYRRNGDKMVRHVYGSWASHSLFGYKKDLFEELKDHGLLFLAKSPRECMSISELLNFNYKVLGIVQGEEIKSLTQGQKESLLRALPSSGNCVLKLLTDSDNKSSYGVSVQTAEVIKKELKIPKLEVHVCSIYASSDKKHKDFTDLCQASYFDKEKTELIKIIESQEPQRKLKQKELDMFYQAIMEPLKIIK